VAAKALRNVSQAEEAATPAKTAMSAETASPIAPACRRRGSLFGSMTSPAAVVRKAGASRRASSRFG